MDETIRGATCISDAVIFLSKLKYFHFHSVMVGVRKIFSLSVDQELGLWAWPRDTD